MNVRRREIDGWMVQDSAFLRPEGNKKNHNTYIDIERILNMRKRSVPSTLLISGLGLA
jgi:hypothetical protein